MDALDSIVNRHSMMVLFSSSKCPMSHSTRLVLAEKNIAFDVRDVADKQCAQDLAAVNPYNSVPTLVDRDLVVYDVGIVNEYIDERFPHPPLMLANPVARATLRLALYQVYQDWYQVVRFLDKRSYRKNEIKLIADKKKQLVESIASTADILLAKPFFMSEEPTLVDCAIAPILWRLPFYQISLPRQAKSIEKYAENFFSRQSFQDSLTEVEREMHLLGQ